MKKIESAKIMFHSKSDGLSVEDIQGYEKDGWELHYLLHPSEVPLLKSILEI